MCLFRFTDRDEGEKRRSGENEKRRIGEEVKRKIRNIFLWVLALGIVAASATVVKWSGEIGTKLNSWGIGGYFGYKMQLDSSFLPSGYADRNVITFRNYIDKAKFASGVFRELIINRNDSTKFHFLLPVHQHDRDSLENIDVFVFNKTDSTIEGTTFRKFLDYLNILRINENDWRNTVQGNMFYYNAADTSLKKITFEAMRDSLIVLKADYPNLLDWDVQIFNAADSSTKGLSFIELVDSLGVLKADFPNLANNDVLLYNASNKTIFGYTFAELKTALNVDTVDYAHNSDTSQVAINADKADFLWNTGKTIAYTASAFSQTTHTHSSLTGNYTGTINFTTADGDYSISVSNGVITSFVFTP